jgi:hypothetical protein
MNIHIQKAKVVYEMFISHAHIYLILRSTGIPKPVIRKLISPCETVIASSLLKIKHEKKYWNKRAKLNKYKKYLIQNNKYNCYQENVYLVYNVLWVYIDLYVFKKSALSRKFITNYINIMLYSKNVDLDTIRIPIISKFAQKKFLALLDRKGYQTMDDYITKNAQIKNLKNEVKIMKF